LRSYPYKMDHIACLQRLVFRMLNYNKRHTVDESDIPTVVKTTA
jgi:hypothetical protein